MMLVTSKAIRSKDDVVKVARLYFSRWRIEEYFRAKKQILDFENFRVRSLVSINALNFHITIAMTFRGQHRTIWQEVSARIFASIQSLENEGILYVFLVFQTEEVG